jgi:cyclic beta-1,2-glucan synthetase
MERSKPLSSSTGSVLDPIMSLRVRLKIMPGQAAKVSFLLNTGESRESVLEFVEKYSPPKL